MRNRSTGPDGDRRRARVAGLRRLRTDAGEAALEAWCSELCEAHGAVPLSADEEYRRQLRRQAGKSTDLAIPIPEPPPAKKASRKGRKLIEPVLRLVRREPPAPQPRKTRMSLAARVGAELDKIDDDEWYSPAVIPGQAGNAWTYANRMAKAHPGWEWRAAPENGDCVLFARRKPKEP